MHYWRLASNKFVDDNVKGEVVLDIGCGTTPHPKATITLDSQEEVEWRGETFHPDIVADITEKIPLQDNTVDCIIMNNTLEHIYSPWKAIDECYRVLKPEGTLLVAVPFLVKIHQEPVDFLRYTKFMLERLFSKFQYRITPVGSMTDIYRENLRELKGMIGRRKALAYISVHAIAFLSVFLPEIEEPSYVRGYLVYATKTQNKFGRVG